MFTRSGAAPSTPFTRPCLSACPHSSIQCRSSTKPWRHAALGGDCQRACLAGPQKVDLARTKLDPQPNMSANVKLAAGCMPSDASLPPTVWGPNACSRVPRTRSRPWVRPALTQGTPGTQPPRPWAHAAAPPACWARRATHPCDRPALAAQAAQLQRRQGGTTPPATCRGRPAATTHHADLEFQLPDLLPLLLQLLLQLVGLPVGRRRLLHVGRHLSATVPAAFSSSAAARPGHTAGRGLRHVRRQLAAGVRVHVVGPLLGGCRQLHGQLDLCHLRSSCPLLRSSDGPLGLRARRGMSQGGRQGGKGGGEGERHTCRCPKNSACMPPPATPPPAAAAAARCARPASPLAPSWKRLPPAASQPPPLQTRLPPPCAQSPLVCTHHGRARR